MTRERRHGTSSMYTGMACRCAPCCDAEFLASKRRKLRRLQEGDLKVPIIGSVRRIQALRAGGWTVKQVSAETGIAWSTLDSVIWRERTTITRTLHNRIADAYEQLSARPGPSNLSRCRALARGWAPPLAWPEGAIDDPDAVPVGVRTRDEHTVDLDEWWRLIEFGENPHRAAERCGVSIGSIERAAYRAGRPDIGIVASKGRREAAIA